MDLNCEITPLSMLKLIVYIHCIHCLSARNRVIVTRITTFTSDVDVFSVKLELSEKLDVMKLGSYIIFGIE